MGKRVDTSGMSEAEFIDYRLSTLRQALNNPNETERFYCMVWEYIDRWLDRRNALST